MLDQKALLKLTSFYRKIGLKIKLTKKREKYCNMAYPCMLRLERLTSNAILIILLESKKVKILQIIYVFLNCIIYKVVKRSSNMSYWPLSLPPLSVHIKKQYKSLIKILLYGLLPKNNLIQSVNYESIIPSRIDQYQLKILRNSQDL